MNALDVIVATRGSALSTAERLVLVHVALYAGGDAGECFASRATLAEATGLSVGCVRETLRSLVRHGVLECRRPATFTDSARYVIRPACIPRGEGHQDTHPHQDTEGGELDGGGSPGHPGEGHQDTPGGSPGHPDQTVKDPDSPETDDPGFALVLVKPTEKKPSGEPPPWASKVQGVTDRAAFVREVVAALSAIRGRAIDPQRCATDAAHVVGLWTALGRPPIGELRAEVEMVARWAQHSPEPAAARSLRAEGWAEGTDRSRDVSTLCVRAKWGDRLEAARRWADADAAGRPVGARHAPSGAATGVRRPTRSRGGAFLDALAEHAASNNHNDGGIDVLDARDL